MLNVDHGFDCDCVRTIYLDTFDADAFHPDPSYPNNIYTDVPYPHTVYRDTIDPNANQTNSVYLYSTYSRAARDPGIGVP